MQKTGPRREVLFRTPVVYRFILVVTAAVAFGDSWTRSSGCAGGRAAASGIAPGCIVEAFPIAIAEAFPVCLASGTCTDIMAAARASAAVVSAARAPTAAVVSAAARAPAPAVVSAARASAATVAAASTVVTATTTSTITTIPSTSTKSKATHILHSPFLLVCTISYGTPRQSVSDCFYVIYCHPLFFFS